MNVFKRAIVSIMLVATQLPPGFAAGEDQLALPPAGRLVPLSKPLQPIVLRGLKVRSDHPFELSFLLENGTGNEAVAPAEARRLVAYFLAALTIPKEDLWVNLSPYEQDRIVPDGLAGTMMGRDMLAEDYVLKQVTASLLYPEGDAGRRFWARVYAEARRRFGREEVPVDTRNKVWILPEKAEVYENVPLGTAFVRTSSLRVMLEEDYAALAGNVSGSRRPHARDPRITRIAREVIVPLLTHEVNEGGAFARLRQVYSALILAEWYRRRIRDSFLNAAYTGRGKTEGIRDVDPKIRERIYARYIRSFKQGVYNYIKEDLDPRVGTKIPRRYFSGGVQFTDLAMTTEDSGLRLSGFAEKDAYYTTVEAFLSDRPNHPVPGARGALGTQIGKQLEYIGKVAQALRSSHRGKRPEPPYDKVHARIYHQLWDPLAELLHRYTDNPNYSGPGSTSRYNTMLMRAMLALIGRDIASKDSLIVPTLRLVTGWLRQTPQDLRVNAVRRAVDGITGIHLYNRKFDRSKPTVLFIRGILVGVAATFDEEFKLLEQNYNIAYFEYDEMRPLEQTSRLLNAEIDRYGQRYGTRISAAVLYSHGNTVFRDALRIYAAEHGGEADVYKGIDVIELAPPLGGSREAELLRHWVIRVLGARLIMPIQYHLANVYNPYGKIQKNLTAGPFIELYRGTVGRRLVIMPSEDHHNPAEPNGKVQGSKFFENFARLLEGSRMIHVEPANHSTVTHKGGVVAAVTSVLLHRIDDLSNLAGSDEAQLAGADTKGGIDLNTDRLVLQTGQAGPSLDAGGINPGVPEDLAAGIAGLEPVILSIVPGSTPQTFMGISEGSSAVRPAH